MNSNSENGIWFWSVRLATQSSSEFSIGFELVTTYLESISSQTDQTLYQFKFDMRYYY